MKSLIKTTLFSSSWIALGCLYFNSVSPTSTGNIVDFSNYKSSNKLSYEAIIIDTQSPPCLQMYYAIEKYAKQYEIPLDYAYGIAYYETRYTGPFQWKYKHSQKSYAGAVGPMQIMPSTADMMWPEKDKINTAFLMNNINFNVETSMKLLKRLHGKYNDWSTVFGCYNTGRPCVNEYAKNVYNYKPNFKN